MKLDQVETKCGVPQIVTIVCVTYVQTDFQIRALIKQFLIQYLGRRYLRGNGIAA